MNAVGGQVHYLALHERCARSSALPCSQLAYEPRSPVCGRARPQAKERGSKLLIAAYMVPLALKFTFFNGLTYEQVL